MRLPGKIVIAYGGRDLLRVMARKVDDDQIEIIEWFNFA